MAAQCSSLRPASAPACAPRVCEQDRNRFHAILARIAIAQALAAHCTAAVAPSLAGASARLVLRNLILDPTRCPVSAPAPRWDIFCTVVDNYGDVGVAWRLARQLAGEHAIAVRLFVDDMRALARLAPEIDAAVSEPAARGGARCR